MILDSGKVAKEATVGNSKPLASAHTTAPLASCEVGIANPGQPSLVATDYPSFADEE